MREPDLLSLRRAADGRLIPAAALLLALAACRAEVPAPAPAVDLPAVIDGVTAQCRAIGGTPAAAIDGVAASVTCTRPDGVSETWTISASGR